MPYKDPAKRKAYKHAYYMRHKQETLERVKEYRKGHPEMVKSINRKYNQKKTLRITMFSIVSVRKECVVNVGQRITFVRTI